LHKTQISVDFWRDQIPCCFPVIPCSDADLCPPKKLGLLDFPPSLQAETRRFPEIFPVNMHVSWSMVRTRLHLPQASISDSKCATYRTRFTPNLPLNRAFLFLRRISLNGRKRQNPRLSTDPEKATEPGHLLNALSAVRFRIDKRGRLELSIEEKFYRRFECLSACQSVVQTISCSGGRL
jgi:hypothetical protein